MNPQLNLGPEIPNLCYKIYKISQFIYCNGFQINVQFGINTSLRGIYMEGNFNRHLGSKLRMRRLALGLTQTKVAQAINVTFQQIQKYEKGTNGISSLRLMQLASFLKVPVMYFFDDYSSLLNQNTESTKLGLRI